MQISALPENGKAILMGVGVGVMLEDNLFVLSKALPKLFFWHLV